MSCSMMKFSMSGKKRSPRRVKKKSPARKSPKRSKSPTRKSPKRSTRKSPKRSTRKSPKRSKSPARKVKSGPIKKADTRGCSLQHTKKYTQRASPAYPANQCCGDVMVGNDGKRWQSRPDSNGVCHWYKL